MTSAMDQIDELKQYYGDKVSTFIEGGISYILIPAVSLAGEMVDLLLCPVPRDGYPSRLFFSTQVTTAQPRNWNASGVRIGESLWWACSWKISENGVRLAQMIAEHLGALR